MGEECLYGPGPAAQPGQHLGVHADALAQPDEVELAGEADVTPSRPPSAS